MEYAPGGSLLTRLEKLKAQGEQMPIAEALQITLDIANGLAVLHSRDIVHRDIKPSNILFDNKGHAKLADLGLAQIPGGPSMRSQLSNPTPHPGTPGYMSPEQEHERGLLKPPSDIYALGLVIFEMLTGRNYALLRSGTQASSLQPNILPAIDALLMRMLATDINTRPWDGKECAELLMGILSNSQPVSVSPNLKAAAPVKNTAPLQPSKKLRPIWLLMAALLGFGLLLAGVWVFRNNQTAAVPTQTKSMPIETIALASATLPSTPNISITTTPSSTHNISAFVTTITAIPTEITDSKGVKMRLVPAGEFTMGSEDGDADEKPVHQVYLDDYYIDTYEVTNILYKACVNDGMCTMPSETRSNVRSNYYGNKLFDNYPVINVSWYYAKAYCEWRGPMKSAIPARLPTEAEWEKAARGEDKRIFPWGDEGEITDPWDGRHCDKANYWNRYTAACVGDTVKVGSYPNGVSPYGIYDLAGNVWEWVADWYDSNYYQKSPTNNPLGPVSGQARVLRGGSWDSYLLSIMSTTRSQNGPLVTSDLIGFRCARSTP